MVAAVAAMVVVAAATAAAVEVGGCEAFGYLFWTCTGFNPILPSFLFCSLLPFPPFLPLKVTVHSERAGTGIAVAVFCRHWASCRRLLFVFFCCVCLMTCVVNIGVVAWQASCRLCALSPGTPFPSLFCYYYHGAGGGGYGRY